MMASCKVHTLSLDARSKFCSCQSSAAHRAGISWRPPRSYVKTQNWACPLLALRIGIAGSFFFTRKSLCWSADQSFSDIADMVMKEDDMHDRISAKRESDDLWSSLSSYMDNKGGQDSSAASQSLMGLSASLFNDVDTFLMDKEDPAEYIPAPPISVADLQMNNQLETVLYKLREVVPGTLVEAGMDKKLLEVWSFVSDNIKVQDPLLCLKGKERLWSWLCKLATMNVEVHLDEIYSERSRDDSFKGYIHAVWTLQFPKELPSISASSSSECEGRSSLQLNLCGESKLLVDKSGQVMSIESNWFIRKGREEELDSIKLLLTSLLL